MLDQKTFTEILRHYCWEHSLECDGAWKLGEGVFVARVYEIQNRNQRRFLFFYDPVAHAFVDPTLSNARLTVALCQGMIKQEKFKSEGVSVQIFYLAPGTHVESFIRGPETALAFVKDLLVFESGIGQWCDMPEEVPYQ